MKRQSRVPMVSMCAQNESVIRDIPDPNPPSKHRPATSNPRPASSQQRNCYPNLPPRAASSLGFAWQKTLNSPFQLGETLMGFDITQYMRRHGLETEIRIGQNGKPTTDDFLKTYLEECRRKILQEQVTEESGFSIPDREGGSDAGDLEPENVGPVSLKLSRKVPLCWEDQLEKAEVTTNSRL